VVLAAVTGALGRYLKARGVETADLELRAMVPVSVRAAEEHGALGNRVATMMAPLPVWCEDPTERIHVITESMGDLKQSGQAVGAEMLTKLTDFAPPTIAAQAARLQSRQRFFNMVVTNVPGPQFPLYLMGREMLAIVPMVPLAERQSMCVGIMSYNGQLNFGLIGDYDSMPDLDSFGLDLEASIAELSAAVPKRKRAARKAPKRTTAKKTAAKAKGNGATTASAKASSPSSGSRAKA
jgi:diacylglycerol O-acyltransferase